MKPRTFYTLGTIACLLTAAAVRGGTIAANRMPASGWAGQVGVPGGIPTNYTQFCNVRVFIPGSNLVAVGDGVANDTAALQAALTLCPNNQFIYLPAGTYLISGIWRAGSQNYDGTSHPFSVVIRGAGPSLTHLISTGAEGGNIISLVNNGAQYGGTFAASRGRGDTTFTINSNVGYYGVGSYLQIMRDNSTSGARNPSDYMNSTCSQIVKVTAINGSTVNFTPALNDPVIASSDSFAAIASGPMRCGIEDLSVERTTFQGTHNIFFQGAYECWVKNVESIHSTKWHIRWEFSAHCEVRQCYLHDTWDGGGDSGYGVGLFRYCCNNLVEDNVGRHLRHSYILEYGGQGNVFGYNYSREPLNENLLKTDYMMGDLILHGGNPRYNLFEGNVAATIRFDDVLGGSDYNTAFRNRIQRKGLPSTLYALFGSDIQRWNYGANLVGNVYDPANEALRRWGTDQDSATLDANSQASAFLDGEVDLGSGSTTWAGSDHSLPNSYYLSSKPTWFGNLNWPATGPGITATSDSTPPLIIPAVVRYTGITIPRGLNAPTNLKVVPQ